LHCTKLSVLTLAASVLVGCAGGDKTPATDEPDAEAAAMANGEDAVSAGDTPVTLQGALTFVSEESNADGTPSRGMSYSRRFSFSCTFSQPAVTWENSETGAAEFRLTETEPGVVESNASGTAEAVGDAVVRDLEHEPPVTETSTVRLRGAATYCLIRRLEPAQFGVGYDIELDFQAALSGTVQTSTQAGSGSSVTSLGGLALPTVLALDPSAPDGSYSLINEPGNTGMHLHAAPLLLRPALGPRPEGDDAEVQLQQQVYDGLRAQPQTAWVGLNFDPENRVWTFRDQHTTASGAVHSLQVRIEVVP
jgi:hypothetical protein